MNFDPFATVEVPFDKNAAITDLGPIDGTGAAAAVAALASKVDDLIVISHGWNNDVDDARGLYAGFFKAVANAWVAAGLAVDDQGKTGVVALYWPSKKFDESDLLPGGAAAIADATPVDYAAAITKQIANLKDAYGQFDPPQQALLDLAAAQVSSLASPDAQNAFVGALAGLFPNTTGEPDKGLDAGIVGLAQRSGTDILAEIQTQLGVTTAPPPAVGGAGGPIDGDAAPAPAPAAAAAGFNPIAGIQQAANLLLNLTTYYVMKERAGVVGQTGAAPLVAAALAANPSLRVHLVGHSFGGRLVSSLANSLPDGVQVRTMSLLQAAYSHYGMAPAPADGSRPIGAFRDVITKSKVRDIVQVTHSNHDWAVGAAYPIASFIAHQTASAVPISVPGTANSPWGGMGANGAQQTAEAFDDTMLPANNAYAALPAGKIIRNLKGDDFIAGHGDVDVPQVAWAFLQGFTLGRP